MKEFKVDFYDINYFPNIIYFKANFSWNQNNFLVTENFVSETRSVSFTQRQYFNLNHILNLKQFKIEISN